MEVDETQTRDTLGVPQSVRGARALLSFWSEHGAESRFLRSGEELVVGRAADAGIAIANGSVSRHHARFSFDGERVWVEDLGSRNGTYVDGAPVHGRAPIADGSEVRIGSVLVDARLLRVSLACAQASSLGSRASTAGTSGQPARILAATEQAPALVLEGARMIELLRVVKKVAPLTAAVLVWGETGSGKEHVARALHEASGRGKAPFRALNCGALPAQLVEGVLFGHTKGAFTGADQARAGIFEEAAAGTVFLDEVGELSPAAQVALLRVLETRAVTRLGSTKEIPIEARIVAATHRDLEHMVERGEFREDLLHRLSAFVLRVPPLRERPDELRPLARLFIARALAEGNLPFIDVDESAWAALEAGRYPGNVRQLRNLVTRATLLCDSGCLYAHDIHAAGSPLVKREPEAVVSSSHDVLLARGPARMDDSLARGPARLDDQAPAPIVPLETRQAARSRELAAVQQALEKTYGHKGRAAELLGMPARTFRRRLRELEAQRERT